MSWRARIGFIAIGLLCIGIATMQLHAGRFVFVNASYHQTTFAASGIGIGIVLILLSTLPRGDWLYRRISTRGTGRSGARLSGSGKRGRQL